MKLSFLVAAVSLAALFPAFPQPEPPQDGAVQIDHFILGINNLDRGIAEFERLTGVRPVFGGVHPGRGTQNALASLGEGTYIEILAPDPNQPNPEQPIEGLKALTSLTPAGWALSATDLAAVKARAEAEGIEVSQIRGGSRALPDGATLAWRTLGVVSPAHQWHPFFIQWGNPALQPANTSPGGCTLASVSLQDPSPGALRQLFDAVGLKMTVTSGDPARMTIVLDCPKGRVEIS